MVIDAEEQFYFKPEVGQLMGSLADATPMEPHDVRPEEVDVALAVEPEASMGTAIEMWEAYQAWRTVVAIRPLVHNWAVKFLSHEMYTDLAAFEAALTDGSFARRLDELSHERK